MFRTAIRLGIVAAALVAPLMVACIDYHTAENCELLGSCPYPDAGDGGDATMDAPDGSGH
jgi:hypothetical protein